MGFQAMSSYALILLILIENISFSQPKVKSINLREVYTIGSSDQSLFIQVGDIACDNKGSIYISDQYQYKVKKFDSKGDFLSEFGKRGKNSGEFQAGPSKIDCVADTIAMVDLGTTRILFSTINFSMINEITTSSPIIDIAFDKHGRLYTSMIPFGDKENIVGLYDRNGNIISRVPLYKTGRDPLFNIAMLCVDTNGYLIVGYSYINKIIVCNDKYQILTQFKIEGLPDESVANKLEGAKFGSMPEGELFRDIAVDNKGYIYLLGGFYSKHPNKDVFVTNRNGDLLTTFVLPDESGILYVDRNGFLYTREQKRTIVKKYAVQYVNF